MFLSKLKLLNFRSHEDIQLQFKSKLIFFIGENGAGKTNIIEAINLFATLKSFRDNSDEELINWKQSHYFVKGEFSSEETNKVIEIGYSKGEALKRKVKLNGDVIQKKQDIIGEMRAVVFSPVDLKIIDGGPSERRRFIDGFISTVNRNYFANILDYNKILKHRNTLLKKKDFSQSELLPWDQLLVKKGTDISKERARVIAGLDIIYRENLSKLSGNKDDFHITYKPNVSLEEDYAKKLSERISRDTHLGYTSVGIHRDDIFVGRDNKDIIEFGSQGQKRSTVIALKTSQFQFIQKEIGEAPILLIDDVIRELDVKRREYFVSLLMDCGQAFFTTTDLEGIQDYIGNLQESKEVFLIQDGNISQVE
ncbi:MAG TPA: DNA replication/repair protein RecF [Leptospiraceae bacterium]|nr:DNA replication/repair protein RecF [Leptospiraceae bacterium]HMW04885.1 DNA replication/repair protein RecF [Leptospiraceae bacterium]HMX32568.1 DNA replication/repair protein RecF [Leptospiraceae bacterium]HMY30894.1 DNA replication/repair protein RecF [Leptospiraceae bacterium]HMZ62698.1 DNA replication/repair protein RecF [Leptospiraceae bacterium]